MIIPRLSADRVVSAGANFYAFLVTPEDASNFSSLCSPCGAPDITPLLGAYKFVGKKDQSVLLSWVVDGKPVHGNFLGLGSAAAGKNLDFENVRRALGTAIKNARRVGAQNVQVLLPSCDALNMSCDDVCHQSIIVSSMALYNFDELKDIKNKKESYDPQVTFCGCGAEQNVIDDALLIADALNFTRRLADMPPNLATPTYVSEQAQKVADAVGLKCTIFGKERALELGMGGLLAVGAGSAQPFKFVTLEYKAANATKTIALVGKGITFDTGGISLKPANFMTGMKYDMSGASAVIGAMKVIGQLKPNVNVVGLMPLTENMPGGSASRQDDIIVHMNGVTSEIENTDAEGRLVLADALCYAEKFFKPDLMIDIATLTGACSHALGTFYAGMMTDDDALAGELFALGQHVGDKVWRLPFDDVYAEGVKAEMADIANSGKKSYYAGTIIGGMYLKNFVKDARWAHLDIAGVADGVPGVSYLGNGATGAGVRLFVEFVKREAQR